MTLTKEKTIRKCRESDRIVSNSVSTGGSCEAYRDNEAIERLMNSDDTMKGTIKKCEINANENEITYHPLVVHILVVFFGISAWIGVNGIYVQLPLLVSSSPEAWNLAAYLVVVIQAANVGPAAYTIAKKFYPSLNESLCIFGLLLTGTISMCLLAFFYDETSYIGGAERSVILFVCAFFTALVGCTSSVLFMPYLRNYSEKFLVSYFIGEGLSGVLPSVVAFLQGVGGNAECAVTENGTFIEIAAEARFTPRDYFIFIFSILLLSLCTFGLLQYLPSVRDIDDSSSAKSDSCAHRDDKERCDRDAICCTCDVSTNFPDNDENKDINLTRTIYFHILVGFVCFFGNGFLPGIQTFSCLPYGNVAFHLTVTLANIANPTACLLYLWINSVNIKILDGLTIVGIVSCTYAIYLATMSPIPPMRDTAIGATLAVAAWIILTGIISYLKLSITSTLRQKHGAKALLGVGIVMQSGSACGAIVSILLINYTTLFRQHKPCIAL